MPCFRWLALTLAACASIAGAADDPVVALGKQRAAASTARWELRDLRHPQLGSIKVAVWLDASRSDAGRDKIVSSVYLSCARNNGRIAIELVNASVSDPDKGLGPKELPRLTCTGVVGNGSMRKSEIAALWEINEFGDVLARGLDAARLRQCATIDIAQEVALPPGWPKQGQQVAIQIAPYARELDVVFTTCDEPTAYAAAAEAPPARQPVAKAQEPVRTTVEPVKTPEPAKAPAEPTKAPAEPVKAASAEAPWVPAHAVASGRTNIRASASISSPVVMQIAPGAAILVRNEGGDWWRMKPKSGAGRQGFIRRDRFVVDSR